MNELAPARLLLVEDDELIAAGLVYSFAAEGYQVSHVSTVTAALDVIADQTFDVALIDLQLPDGTGFTVRERLAPEVAVIFLSVVDDEGNVVRALEGGAEDYVTKPFRLRELLARVRAVRRRRQTGQDRLQLGQVTIDRAAGRVTVDGAAVELTAVEYRLLLAFAHHPGQLLSRRQLQDVLWDEAGGFIEDNTLTVYVKRLRRKLGSAATIETVRGLGYRAS
jgi:DNA-binding response OmpR family regulator